jgi:hypothetical protein
MLVNLLVANVPSCVTRNANTLGLYNLQLPDAGAGSRPLDSTRFDHRTDELLMKQNTVCAGQATSQWEVFFFFVKGTTADATDAPQPWGLLCNPVMKMIRVCFVFPSNGAPVEWNWQGKTEVLGGKTCPSATLSTSDPTWTDWSTLFESTGSAVYQGSSQGTELYRPTELGPWRAVLVRAVGFVLRS